jgi:hypothetical protein
MKSIRFMAQVPGLMAWEKLFIGQAQRRERNVAFDGLVLITDLSRFGGQNIKSFQGGNYYCGIVS